MKLTTTRTELNLIQQKDYSEIIDSLKEEGAVKFIKHLQDLTDEEYTIFLEKKQLLTQNQELFYWVVREKQNKEKQNKEKQNKEKQNKEKQTQKYIGTMGVMPYLGSDSAFHIGFRISKAFQGKGFATELGKAVIDFVKNELKHKQIYGLIMEGNIASQTLLQKLGFEFVGSDFNTDYQIQLETYRLDF